MELKVVLVTESEPHDDIHYWNKVVLVTEQKVGRVGEAEGRENFLF